MKLIAEKPAWATFKVAATYIGTVVGAGFASGQEVLQFFGFFGVRGLWGLLVSTILFIFFGWVVLDLGMKLNATSHLEVIHHTGGRWLGTVIDYVITFFLFGAFTAMAAGAGAIFFEQFHISAIIGSGFLVLVTLLTVMMGLNGVINSISMIVPILLGSVLGIGIWTVLATNFHLNPVVAPVSIKAAVPFWPFAAVIYVSYNLVMAVAVLAPTGARYHQPEVLRNGAIIGGLGLGLGSLAIYLALAPNLPQAARFEVPMVYVAGRLHGGLRIFYSAVLLAEIYTTAVGCLYGFVARITSPDKPTVKYYIIGVSAAALLASLLGFTTMVRTLYPAVGYAGLLLLVGLAYYVFKRWRQPQAEME